MVARTFGTASTATGSLRVQGFTSMWTVHGGISTAGIMALEMLKLVK